jgi:hypothetical protein
MGSVTPCPRIANRLGTILGTLNDVTTNLTARHARKVGLIIAAFPMRFLKPVELSEKCLLHEVLLWVAFRRLPIAISSAEFYPEELRDAEGELDSYGYAANHPDIFQPLTDQECAATGLPPDPRMAALLEYGETEVEASDFGEEDALRFQREMQEWRPKYESVIEYSASRIFVALKEGRLAASGKLLPEHDPDRALKLLQARDQCIRDLPTVEIPSHFWSLSGIDWLSNAARNHHEHYCWIRCLTEEVLKTFPGEGRVLASGVEGIGANFVFDEASEKPLLSMRLRGRPAFHWDAFHLEVADFVKRGELPAKKEAAIQHFQDWFERTLNQRPSRSSIGEKLKPYYDRFMKSADRK